MSEPQYLYDAFKEINDKIDGLQADVDELKARAYGRPTKYPPIKTKQVCERAGGEWDEQTKTCKFPKGRAPEKTGEIFESSERMLIRDESTGIERIVSVLPQEKLRTGEQFEEDLEETAKFIMTKGLEHQKHKPLLEKE